MIKRTDLVKTFFLFVLSALGCAAFAQQKEFTSQNIKTVYFEKQGDKLAYPILSVGGSETIILHFDMLSSHQETLYYKLIHCERDWNVSDIFYTDYAEGFEENPLSNSEASFNTLISYTHYQLTLPNDDISFKVSGNYLLKVYESGKEDNPLLCRRICVHEDAAPISVRFRKPVGQASETGQESEIKISVGNLGATDLYRQITLTILQNGRWDKSKINILPDFVGDGSIEYNTLSGSTFFNGGNEFRDFDIKTIRQKTQYVRDIAFVENRYQVFLLPSENRQNKQYFFNKDLNGKYLIALENDDDPDQDADYVYVYFTLPCIQEMTTGSVYVTGALTNWDYTFDNRMTYNASKGWYEATLLLKQGWYNYEFDFIPDGKSIPDNTTFEGSHYDTENDYLMLVYFNDPRLRYDRLVEASIVNTIGNN
jgi:hypothetical protein